MRRRAASLVLAGLTALSLLPAPASATHGWDLPIRLHEGKTAGTFWVAYKVKTDGAGVTTHFRVDNLVLPNQIGAQIYKGNDLYFGITQSFLAGYNGALVDVNVVPGYPVHFERTEPTPEYPWASSAMNINGFGTKNPYVGELTFVWWVAGANKGVEFSIDAEEGVRLTGGRVCPPEATSCTYGTGWESGTKTFVYTSDDFSGPVNAKAGVGSVAARAHVGVTRRVTIEETLLGQFVAFGTHADQLKVDKPNGSTQDCSLSACNFTSVEPSTRAGPGTYTFHATGAGGGPALLVSFGEFIVAGADMRIPE